MTRRFRRILFWIFVLFFLIFSISAVFFAQGYRFDWLRGKIVKTGGIFIKTSIPKARVYLDDNFAKSTAGFLNYTLLIENLKPKSYSILIFKEGFLPWHKNLEIKAGIVTELTNITLFAADPHKIKVFDKTPKNFILSSDAKQLGQINNGQFSIYDLEGKFTAKHQVPKTSHDWFWLNPERPTFFSINSRQLQALNLKNSTSSAIALNVVKINYWNNKLYWLDAAGWLYKYDISSEIIEKTEISLNPNIVRTFSVSEKNLALITNAGNLALLNLEDKKLKEIDVNVGQALFSQDKEKLLYVKENKVWIYYLTKTSNQPIKSAGTKELLIETEKPIDSSFWLSDSEHIGVFTNSDLIVIERDDREKNNSVRFLQGIDWPILYDSESEILYFGQKDSLYKVNLTTAS